jgi:hypothetical protein
MGAAEGRRDNPLLMATVWPLALVAVFLSLSVRRCQRLSRYLGRPTSGRPGEVVFLRRPDLRWM